MAGKARDLKQARLDERAEAIRRQADAEARVRNIIIVVFAVLIIGGGLGLYVLAANPFAPKVTATSGWTDTSYDVPDEGHDHVPSTQIPVYKHQPPSSGPHYNEQGKGPIAAGNYASDSAPPAPGWIHNLEHGYVVIAYRCADDCQTIHDQIQAEWNSIPKESHFHEVKVVATPYQAMQPKFALLVWDRELDMATFEPATVEGFYQKYVDHGREDLP